MGKKKQSLASKFAKMSDDQRARYMQLKADQEEEIRRRKEQLLNAFMKNKIKKEDTFSRLNKAKINLEWHQFLRVRKCKEMKENCEHTKKWIERTVGLKNRIIDNLVKELDEAEFQYSNNLQSHLLHVDEAIDFYRKYADQLKKQHGSDVRILLDESTFDSKALKGRSENSLIHLKTTLYGQEVEGRASLRENHDYYLKRLDEFLKEYKTEMSRLKRSKWEKSSAIWRAIASTAKQYVEKTDKRRAQLAEMRRLDSEGAQEVSRNQERIQIEEIQIEKYKEEHETLVVERSETIRSLNGALQELKKTSLKLKKDLKRDLERDDQKLRVLSQYSKEAIGDLERIERKGEYLLQLAQSCRKYETQKEKVLRFHKEEVDVKFFVDDKAVEDETGGDLEEVMKVTMEEHRGAEMPEEEEVYEPGEEIYKTETYKILLRHKFKLKPTTSQLKIGEKIQKELEKIDFPTCPKRNQKQTSSTSSSSSKSTGIIDDCVSSLMRLEGMWNLCNKVTLNSSELRVEKSALIEENKHLKATLKAILEEAVLESRTIPRRDVKLKRYASAPVRYA